MDKNPESLEERRKFEESEHMNKVIEDVSTRLGFNTNLQLGKLNYDTVYSNGG